MAHRVGVFAGVAHRGRVATADVPAAQTQPKMQPRGMQTQAFLAAVGSPGSDTADGRQVRIDEYRRHECASLVVVGTPLDKAITQCSNECDARLTRQTASAPSG